MNALADPVPPESSPWPSHCPGCGAAVRPDVLPPTIGRLSFDHGGVARIDGRDLRLTRSESVLLTTLATAFPRSLPRATLMTAIASQAVSDNLVSVLICRICDKLVAAGVQRTAIVSSYGVYRLDAAGLA